MKKTLIFLLVLLGLVGQLLAQDAQICGLFKYVQATHFSRDGSQIFSLTFDNHTSLYQEENIKVQKEKVSKTQKDEGIQFDMDVPRNNLNPEFFYNDRSEFYFREIWYDEELLVKEEPLVWEWQLGQASKIGNFVCQDARITFRGRSYTAWFTQAIPVPFGPWKFQGLSGLILEVYDQDRVFHIVAQSLQINQSSVCNIQVDKTKFLTALNIQGYLQRQKQLLKEYFAKLSSRLPKYYAPITLNEDCKDCRESVELFEDK
jgi:GLPGLI family protein